MSKTAREVIAKCRRSFRRDLSDNDVADDVIEKLDAAGFVIVPKDDIRPYPILLSEDLLVGLVAHLTAGAANLSVVRLQISRMREAAAKQSRDPDGQEKGS